MLVAGNWKMNTERTSAVQLAREIVDAVGSVDGVDVAVCPPFINLDAVFNVLHGSEIGLGAQDMHFEESGAFTGAISPSMLRSVGCRYVILGHSERRHIFGETDVSVNLKMKKAMNHKLVPIMCVGETLDQRDAGEENAVVQAQVEQGLVNVKLKDASEVVLAYEPVWAIGTGRTASPEQAQDMHAFIRGLLINQFGEKIGFGISVLYGGSVKPENAEELFTQRDVNGGLIGGASLKADAFAAIVSAARR